MTRSVSAARCEQTLTFTRTEPAAGWGGDALTLTCLPEQTTVTESEEA